MPSLLTSEDIARLGSLDLVARRVVEGFITGLHRSPYHGFSVEFSEHRAYTQGDDLRHVDWRLYARSGRFHIKQYEEETNLRAHILLDVSQSMDFMAAGTKTKLDYGRLLAACLAYMLSRQKDAVGLALFADSVIHALPPRSTRRHLSHLLAALEKAETGGTTRSEPVMHRMAESLKRRGLIILISDLLDDEASVLRGLRHFRRMGHEVIVFHVLDPAERDFALLDSAVFHDMEEGGELPSDPRLVAEDVNARFHEFEQALRTGCLSEGIDFVSQSTDSDLGRALLAYLIKRKKIAG
jgi:uncharacterized protein (DUF58 family)